MLKQYTTNFPDGTSVEWRPITWGEYRKLESTLETDNGPAVWHLYDAVAGLCITNFHCPIAEEYDDLPAGVIGSIGEVILSETGFISTKELVQKQIDNARYRVRSNYYTTGVAYICSAFHLKPSEVDDLTVDQFMDYLAMAEITLGVDIDIPQTKKDVVKFQEIVDPRTGKLLKVPIAKQGSKQSKIETYGRKQ